MKRGYLLPNGCKDLIDVLKPGPAPFGHQSLSPKPLSEMTVSAQMTVRELVEALGQKPFKNICDLTNQQLRANCEHANRVARKDGFIVKKQ